MLYEMFYEGQRTQYPLLLLSTSLLIEHSLRPSRLLFKSALGSMSTRKGAGATRTRKPAHQNSFAFRHNPKSQKTAKILGMANTGLCASCHDKVSSDRLTAVAGRQARRQTDRHIHGRVYAVLPLPRELAGGKAQYKQCCAPEHEGLRWRIVAHSRTPITYENVRITGALI